MSMANTNLMDLRDEIATVKNDITFPAFAGILRVIDETILTRAGGKGVRLYDEIERDCHAFSVLQKRKMAVIARPWTVESASSSRIDKKAADLVREQLNNMGTPEIDSLDAACAVPSNFDLACVNLLDAILKGYSVGEVMWSTDGTQVVAAEVRARNQFRFTFDEQYCLKLRTPEHLMLGISLPGRKFIVHSFGSKDSNPLGLGMGSRLFWPTFFKKNGLIFWLTFLDKFGSPTPIGTYPAGSDDKVKADVLAAVASIAQEAAVALPDNATIKFLEASKSGTVTHEQFAKYMDDQISEAVLGETMTTSSRGGGGLNAGAHAQVQNEVRLELVKADADLLSSTLNATLVPWISRMNYPDAQPPKVWRIIEEVKDLTAQATRDKTIFQMGFRPTLDYIQDTYGGEWEQLNIQPPTGGTAPTPLPTDPASTDAAAAFAETPDTVQRQTAVMVSGEGSPFKSVLDHVEHLASSANNLEELKAAIESAYAGLPLDDLRAVMSMGFAAAQLAGMSDVADGL